jgi:prolyl oligopeptidase
MKKQISIIAILSLIFFASACQPKVEGPDASSLVYPESKKVDQVDDYFGTQVTDPYRWMEDDSAEDVKNWVEAQNAVTFAYLEQIPFRETIKNRLLELYNYPKYSSPFRAGEYYFFYKNDGLQNQSVLYIQKGLDGEPEVFLDPNALSADGTVRVNIAGFSNDDRYAAVMRSEAGSDWREIRIMEVDTKKELEDRVRWVKFSGASWYKDGFFYNRYPEPTEDDKLKGQNRDMKVYYHKIGNPQDKDALIYEDSEHPLRTFGAYATEDERFVFLVISEGTSGNELYYKDMNKRGMDFLPLVKGFENDTYPIDNLGDQILLYTNIGAPNYKVVQINPASPVKDGWKVIIPEKEEVLTGASTGGGYLFCTYLKDANTKVYQYETGGTLVREIELPALGSAGGFGARKEDDILFYTFSSFTYPSTIYKYDIDSGQSEVFRKSEVKFTPEEYETKQVFYPSKDGTKIPMFIIYKKGLKLDGKNPTLLYGYGGFNISLTPSFNALRVVLLENGFVYAMANLRGGGEYGEEWHKAGMLLNKQNVFDDFIAAGEYLIAENYTSNNKLAISGASNGGLLVGAVMTQRPELFKVALPAVGVMDMLRYHKFTIGWAWAVDYGSSEDEEHFRNLYSYSPLHNIKEAAAYPATLVTTADHDDRVVPAHSFKFISTLQEKHSGENPVLIRIETRSGHGSSSTTKMIEETADEYAFMLYNLGVRIN